AAAEIRAIEIELEDLVLLQPELEPGCEKGFVDLALDGTLVRQKQVLGKLLGDRRAALNDAASARVGEQRTEGAGKIEDTMLVEATVLGGGRCLDQVIGELVERDRIVVADAARADFIAVAIEEGDRKLGPLQPVLVGGLAERRDRECKHDNETASAERKGFRDPFDQRPASPPRHMEPVHDHGITLIKLAPPPAGEVDSEVDACVEVEQEAAKAHLPSRLVLVVKQVAHRGPRASLLAVTWKVPPR